MLQAIMVALVMAIAPTVIAIVAWQHLTRKINEIHALVNSNLMGVKSELAQALTEIAVLKKSLKVKR